jgi:hypothetical protein
VRSAVPAGTRIVIDELSRAAGPPQAQNGNIMEGVPSPPVIRFEPVLWFSVVLALVGMARDLDVHLVQEPVIRLPQAMSAPTIDARYAAIKRALPRHGQLGYVSDLPLDQEGGDTLHLQAIYALAPLVLVRDDGSPGLVVANLAHPSALSAICRGRRLDVVRDFGSGLVLLRRRGRS